MIGGNETILKLFRPSAPSSECCFQKIHEKNQLTTHEMNPSSFTRVFFWFLSG